MNGTIVIMFPAPPLVFGGLLAIMAAYLVYRAVKVVSSLVTG